MSWTQVSNDVKVCGKCNYVGCEFEMYCEGFGNEMVFIVSDCDFEDVLLEPNSIIYCDIPYKNTTHYNTSKGFDYERFYIWCQEKKNEGHRIYISEYDMPSDIFKCVWQKEIISGLTVNDKQKKGVEKLFTVI